MTRIKMCGLTCPEEIRAANQLRPDFVGFVFAPASRRYLSPEQARTLRAALDPAIPAVGVFVREDPRQVAALLEQGVLQIAQLHGGEDAEYLRALRALTQKPLWLACRPCQLAGAAASEADCILLDAGAGEGRTFDWALARPLRRPYFLAGGLTPENVGRAIRALRPYGVDVSSGIETNGRKDPEKMAAFVDAVRKEDER